MAYVKSNELFAKIPTEEIYQHISRPIVIADHLMTPDNMGALIRLADNIGATEMVFLGDETKHSLGKVRRAAASSRGNIHWYFTEETDLRKIVPEGKTIVAIETADNATCVYDTQLPEDVAFIVGSESQGLEENLLSQCDRVVYIPVPGPTRSLNVSHAAAVALFEWQRQMRLRHCQRAKGERSNPKYHHVFFDLDRTLWDFDTAAEVAFEKIYDQYHLKELGIPSAHEFHLVYHPLNEKLWELYRANQITKDDLNHTRFMKPLEHYGIHDNDLADRLSEDYVYWSPRIVRLVPGTMELLQYLKPKYHLHLITNGFQEVQDLKLNGSGMAPYFETLTVSEEVGVKKPNPEIFYYALRKAHATADDSLMIGDEMAVDIDGARVAGMDQMFFNPTKAHVEGSRTYEIQHLLDAMLIL